MGLRIERTTTINVSADELWAILIGDFENVSRWASAVHASRSHNTIVPDGATVGGRVCTLPGFGDTEESFTHLNAQGRSFAYSVEASGLPGFVADLQNHFELRVLGASKTELRNTVTADLRGLLGAIMKPMMARRFNRLLQTTLDDLTHYAETGQVSPGKRKAQAKRLERAAAV